MKTPATLTEALATLNLPKVQTALANYEACRFADCDARDAGLAAREIIATATPALAAAFVGVLIEWLPAEERAQIAARNHFEETTACHSHDFCDANQAMLDALAKIGHHDYNAADQAEADLINNAWTLARAEMAKWLDFTPRRYCLQDAESKTFATQNGVTVYLAAPAHRYSWPLEAKEIMEARRRAWETRVFPTVRGCLLLHFLP